MNNISRVLIALTLLLLVACSQKEKETPNGMKFTVVKDGDGVLPKKDDILVFDYLLKDSKDSVWNNTHEDGMPAAIMVADSTGMADENGMVQMFRMLSKGDSVKLTLSVTKFFRDIVGGPIPQGVDSTVNITYFIQVKDIMQMEAFRAFQTEMMEKKQAGQVGKDAKIISTYLSDNNITAEEDPSGLRYVIHSSNGGAKPTVENCVEVKYTGKFLKDGTVFDQAENISFPLNGVIQGWQVGIPLLGIGDSATFYIPSGMGYGSQGYPGAIPPDAILIFDVTLLKVASGFNQATGSCE